MTDLQSFLHDQILLLDGGMGSLLLSRKPTVDDFGGPQVEGCLELLNERRPEWIRDIHAAYFDAGSDAVETNTFGCNEVVLNEFGLQHRVEELNIQAVKLARDVARSYDRPKFVIGSVGPGTKLVTLGHISYQDLYQSYLAQMRGLLKGGPDAILIETSQDLAQIKLAVRAAKTAMAELKVQVPLWAQVTVETTGTLLLGSDISAVIASLEPLGLDVLGLNCGTGPDEMHAPLSALSEGSPLTLSCLPNAGLPVNEGGKMVYTLGAEAFAKKVAKSVKEFGIQIVGGCCGTTPDYIRALGKELADRSVPERSVKVERSAASLYQAVSLHQEPRPLIVGERTNANGSKLFRDLLAKEDWDGLLGIAKAQAREGAHMLDVCVAYVGRNEVRDMEEFLKRLATQSTLPLMIDSTEVPVIERALQLAPGKCVVNSINFEDGEGKARKILELCKTYGAAVVALTIDEEGMAKPRERKVAIAHRLYDLAVKEYGLDPSDLIIDPLTFTLGSGDEEFRKSAIETLEAIRAIKAELPGVLTILGVSNVSFGLKPAARHVVNALMLYHAVQAGLDLAIFNASKVIPVAKIPEEQRGAVEDLLFDRRQGDYDPLKTVLEVFGNASAAKATEDDLAKLDVTERLKLDILDGEKQRILADVDEALLTFDPLFLINELLLGAMKIVGERFGAGEMQLPFVLESAEAMKTAIKHIEPHLPKEASTTKGRVILATVKGDVHDIGKNLVDIILSNNGYEVENLGIKQPIEAILEAHERRPASAIGLSGLLVKSTVIMRENLQYMAEKGQRVPVLLGGAALTRDFVDQECQSQYEGIVKYAADAFEGLKHLDDLTAGTLTKSEPAQSKGPAIAVIRRGEASLPLTVEGQSSWVKRGLPAPEPPFWGARNVGATAEELFAYLDTFALIRNRWSYTQGSLTDDAFAALLKEKAEPLLAQLKEQIVSESLLKPKARYGYFPVKAEGDSLHVWNPERTHVIKTMSFPRQTTGRRLCIADFFEPGRFDVLGLQLVTLGHEAAEHTAKLYASNQYSEYFSFHGLVTELTEAYAEWLHARIRRELDVHHKDARELRRLFSQGYQGSRYSYGYPACPDLEGNTAILDLLDGDSIGVSISESSQMVPEFTTSALVAWHPQARYFSV